MFSHVPRRNASRAQPNRRPVEKGQRPASCAPAERIGELTAGIIADLVGLAWAIGSIGAPTFVSGAVVAALMRERSLA
jgi:hypothetical protein